MWVAAMAPMAAQRAGGNGSLRGRRNAEASTLCRVWKWVQGSLSYMTWGAQRHQSTTTSDLYDLIVLVYSQRNWDGRQSCWDRLWCWFWYQAGDMGINILTLIQTAQATHQPVLKPLTCSSIWHLARCFRSWVFFTESFNLGTTSSMDYRAGERSLLRHHLHRL